ncbi:MAG: glucose-6-phosphate dehydrogenase [Desulfobulbaceae bacterium]|nr:glucose-6-phosphate dehydrogenase [Desulfobulbaceae bacterium]
MQPHACDQTTKPDLAPCVIVIFGASGDLTSRKLIPGLFSLFSQGKLPRPFAIVGCSRTEMDDQQFRMHLEKHCHDSVAAMDRWHDFAQHLFYKSVDYDLHHFRELAAYLEQLDQQRQTGGNRIFELAVPPALYPVIGDLLGQSGLADEKGPDRGWSRVIVEKPFGHDLESARRLDATLHNHFNEKQIYRIDHYLAKETVQNTLIFRFANTIFEPIWNRHYIDYVGIVAAEELGVGSRAGYYDQSGVIRDMFQNHMMQLLVLTAMEPPSRFDAYAVQDEKAKVIRSLREFDREAGSKLCLGQYQDGEINGKKVPGYRREQGVSADSRTPTFALMELYIDNWRWQDVPFYLVSGKRLPRKETRIVIQFKQVPHRLFHDVLGDTINANRLVIETYPEERIRLHFQTKSPGTAICLRSMTMDFAYHEHYQGKALDDYARVLLDCMAGDHMLFWRQDGIELSWAFLTPVLEECEKCSCEDNGLSYYPAGVWGPEPAGDTMRLLVDD